MPHPEVDLAHAGIGLDFVGRAGRQDFSVVEHDMKVVFSVADRVTVLYYGKILATGTPDEIQSNARVREVYLGMRH